MLSGSAARGVATERSDLDVYVVLTGDAILVDHDRLDGWINYAYRSLKADRDDRPLERRLDAAESMPWLLDVVFARVEACCAAYDAVRGHHRTRETIDAWGDELDLFRA